MNAFSHDTNAQRQSITLLSDAIRKADTVHTTLAGMLGIVLMLLVAVVLPVIGVEPVREPLAFIVMAIVAPGGVGVLYYLNIDVHNHIAEQARLTEVLVNSLGQGFLVFDQQGLCGKVYSQACLELVECRPADMNIAEVLRIPQEQRGDFSEWLGMLFQRESALSFEDVAKFLPRLFPHSGGRRVTLVYRPTRSKEGEVVNVVLIATDETEEYEAQQVAKQQQSYAEMIIRIFKERNQFQATLRHIRAFLEAAADPDVTLQNAEDLMRQLHTLKAAVKHFNLMDLGQVIHQFENDLRGADVTSDAVLRQHLQVGRSQVESQLNKVLLEVKDMLGDEKEWKGNIREIEEVQLYEFARELRTYDANPVLIQHYLSRIAALPINECFHSFERELRELSAMTEKLVKPARYTGSNPRVLTKPLQEFLFSLTHICRNIIDHGIETPVTRMARGKDAAGQISIHSEIMIDRPGQEWLHIIIRDDGNGIDPQRIRAKLATIDPEGPWQREDDQTVIQRIFDWGFTTSEGLTSLSGRGVGMEAVKREVVLLGGVIRVQSVLYHGASFDIRIPYHLDIDQIDLEDAAAPVITGARTT
jgi:two-component system chemotaxis sensor kinase CheA